MVSRLLDTIIGCAIVLLIGYVPWPGTWRSRSEFGTRVADAADDVNAYLRVALGLEAGERRALRRHAYRRLSDLRTLLQQALAEPPLVSRQAAAWWPVIVALERVLDAVTAFAVERDAAAAPGADPADAEQVARFASGLCDRIRQRQPPETTLPEEGPLAGIATELRTAAAVVAGPSA
ncbi:MAG TPA: FUSC family protein, partial [Leifsonia sp.]